MTPRRALALILAAVACLAAVAGCGGDDGGGEPGEQSARLILDWFPNTDHAGIYGAIDEGFFADERVTVKPEVPSDPSAALKRLAAGRAEFAISYEPEVLIARSQGVPVVAVGAPSSLAVSLATEVGITLVAFTRPPQFSVYSRPDRLSA